MSNRANAKKAAAAAAAGLVQDDMTLGLGTGSTADLFLERLATRIAEEGLRVRGIPSSEATARKANELGIELIPLTDDASIDLTVDGADEIDPDLHLIKGGGGALVREKMIAWRTEETYVVIADESKIVEQLGAFPLPVAILPFGWQATMSELEDKGCRPSLRERSPGDPLVTDDGLYVIDCEFPTIPDPQLLESSLEEILGVVACGLFCGLADIALLGSEDGTVRQLSAE